MRYDIRAYHVSDGRRDEKPFVTVLSREDDVRHIIEHIATDGDGRERETSFVITSRDDAKGKDAFANALMVVDAVAQDGRVVSTSHDIDAVIDFLSGREPQVYEQR